MWLPEVVFIRRRRTYRTLFFSAMINTYRYRSMSLVESRERAAVVRIIASGASGPVFKPGRGKILLGYLKLGQVYEFSEL